jgi:hypothetical protein
MTNRKLNSNSVPEGMKVVSERNKLGVCLEVEVDFSEL